MPKIPSKGTTDTVFLQNAVKTLAANIRFASVDDPIKTIAMTSSVPNEGKSTISVELARALASGGKSVLLVEGDMRRRTLAGLLGIHPRNGIYSVLSGKIALEDAIARVGEKPSFWFLDAEPHIPNPADLFASRRFRRFVEGLYREYDYVIFDTPPISAFVDAAVLGAAVDATLLVVRENFVKRDEIVAAYDQLKKAGANVIGTVLNFCDAKRNEYYYSYYEHDASSVAEKSAPAPAAKSAPAAQPRVTAPVQPRAAAPEQQSAPASGLRPLPKDSYVAPDSTAQFLAGTAYRPRGYEDE